MTQAAMAHHFEMPFHASASASTSASVSTSSSTSEYDHITPATIPSPTNKYSLPRGFSSALFAEAHAGHVNLSIIFGGQSTTNASCIEQAAELFSLHHEIFEPIIAAIDPLLQRLSSSSPALRVFFLDRELCLRTWLTSPIFRADEAFLASAPVSFPLIGLLDMMQYCLICRSLGLTPGHLRDLLSGVTGHSQGIVVAAALARSDCNSWEDFVRVASWAVELLFWIGWESHAAAPQAPVDASVVQVSVERGHDIPSHMLSVRGLDLTQLEKAMADCNRHHFSEEQQLHVALVNGHRNYVVAGTPRSLTGLATRLAPDGLIVPDQSRVPFSKRKAVVSCQFLPISAPFHTRHLLVSAQRLKERLATLPSMSKTGNVTVGDLNVALFHTETGRDVRESHKRITPLVDILVDAIETQTLHWAKTLGVDNKNESDVEYHYRPPISHMIVLGNSRLSSFVHQVTDGFGIRVIDGTFSPAATPDAIESHPIGSRAELFSYTLARWQLEPQAWVQTFSPLIHKQIRGCGPGIVSLSLLSATEPVEEMKKLDYTHVVETRLNYILNAPPVFVAGMWPTTSHPDFAAAIINAGYHVELTGGGHTKAEDMTAAIEKLTTQLPPGRGITINLIYASPIAIGWQIPLLQSLIRRGVPIEGLTIGAGVPSPEIVTGYINDLGLRHISFKPGTVASIRSVIAIAQENPTFPIIIQWTGGRGGGHHSSEDFHEPLLETYGEIRRCENLYIVVGSGFGDAEGILPYFTGAWSVPFGRAPMPIDGALMGSRMMVAREAHTSPQAKKLIIEASGVDDSQWETSYSGKGSVVTVVSEMGQPIHKLATRGVRLWKELDDTVFQLPKSEQKASLAKRKGEIITRLNADSHRPWFGCNMAGKAVDLQDMTYTEVLSRILQLLYVHHQQRWVDSSYQDLFQTFAKLILMRLAPTQTGSDTTSTCIQLQLESDSGYLLLLKINAICPMAATQLLHPEDLRAFVQLCRTRGRKPVNFILDLDEEFEHWFKKDSLWQSEDVEAVMNRDAGRVCILQSPVSLRFSTRDNQPAGDILNDILSQLGSSIGRQQESNRRELRLLSVQSQSAPSSPVSGWIRDTSLPGTTISGIHQDQTRSHFVFRTLTNDVNPNVWRSLLNQHVRNPALSALLLHTTVYRIKSDSQEPVTTNFFHHVFAPRKGLSVHIHVCEDEILLVQDGDSQSNMSVLVRASATASSPRRSVTMGVTNKNEQVLIQLYHPHSKFEAHADAKTSSSNIRDKSPVQLILDWELDVKTSRLLDPMDSEDRDLRVKTFFSQLWLRSEDAKQSPIIISPQIYETFQAVVGQAFGILSPILHLQNGSLIPIEAAVIAAWEDLIRPLLQPSLSGDLLRLLHRSISVRLEPGQAPLSIGEAVTTRSIVRTVFIEEAGKSVVVQVDVLRGTTHKAATILGEFFIKGKFDDWGKTFRDEDKMFELQVNSHVDEAVLLDRDWFHLDSDSQPSLVGITLVFKLNASVRYRNKSVYSSIKTYGTVEQRTWNGTMKPIGHVSFESSKECIGNPVFDFLERRGRAANVGENGELTRVPLQKPGWGLETERIVTAPSRRQSQLYAAISGDLNPIHTSPVFATVAGIPDGSTIAHGMYTVAVCRQVVEDLCGLSTVPESRARLRAFTAHLVSMVRPGDKLQVGIVHEAMLGGRMVLSVTAKRVETGEVVLQGEAEIEQPSTAYVFTGQGSQKKDMGMALYNTSPAAKAVWDNMDRVLKDRFGWSIIHIVKDNPSSLTVSFGGRQGQRVLQNYLAMTVETTLPQPDGSTRTEHRPLLPGITGESESYTFSDVRGLVHATQFAQPAIMILQKATVEHLKVSGLLQQNATFAGHSLGEWGAISSMSPVIEYSATMAIGFYRGLLMHFAIPRDGNGRTGHSMVAVNPKRVGKGLCAVVCFLAANTYYVMLL
jgi:fatty acid synthase subunit beta